MARDQIIEALKQLGYDVSVITDAVPDTVLAETLRIIQTCSEEAAFSACAELVSKFAEDGYIKGTAGGGKRGTTAQPNPRSTLKGRKSGVGREVLRTYGPKSERLMKLLMATDTGKACVRQQEAAAKAAAAKAKTPAAAGK